MICKYKIYADAAADIPVELRDRYGIEVLPIPVTMGERTIQSGVGIRHDYAPFHGRVCDALFKKKS